MATSPHDLRCWWDVKHKHTSLHTSTDSFLASGNFCCQLITFANSLDPDQDPQNVSPDQGPNSLVV